MERPSWGSEIGAEAAVLPGTHELRPEAKRLIREMQRANQTIDVRDLSAEDIWYAWVSVPSFDTNGQSILSRVELDLARKAKCRVAMTEWNWNGWWGHSIHDRVALNSLYAKGIGAAGILHAIMRQGDVIHMAAQSMLIGDGWGIHAICCDRHGRFRPYMVPSGQVTMLYCKYHGDQRLAIDMENMPHFEQPYRMAGIRSAGRVAYVDVLATRNDKTLYVHTINRHFHEALSLRLDVSALDAQPQQEGTLHNLEGRLNNAPAPGESRAPGRIRTESIRIQGNPFVVKLPARSVSVVEIPLQ
jgi:alpha-L-arabinofuranosidase